MVTNEGLQKFRVFEVHLTQIMYIVITLAEESQNKISLIPKLTVFNAYMKILTMAVILRTKNFPQLKEKSFVKMIMIENFSENYINIKFI